MKKKFKLVFKNNLKDDKFIDKSDRSHQIYEINKTAFKNKYIFIVKIWYALSKKIFISSLFSENNTKEQKPTLIKKSILKIYFINLLTIFKFNFL